MQINKSQDTVNTSHNVHMTRAEMVQLAGHLINMVGIDMRLNDHDDTGVHIPPPPCFMIGENYKNISFSLVK